jgi:hypothetical protein
VKALLVRGVMSDRLGSTSDASRLMPEVSSPAAARRKVWFELAVTVLAGSALLATIAVPRSIEVLIGIDPDRGSGLTELLITGCLVGAAAIPAAMARREYRWPESRWAR